MKSLLRLLAVALALALFLVPSAQAASALKIREVYPGSAAAPLAEYVELQMSANGQGDIDGELLRFFDSAGNETATFTVPSDPANSESQRTVLFASAEAAAVGAFSPDFTLPSVNRISPAGGAVCFTGAGLGGEDCVTWGAIPLFGLLSGFPDPQSGNASPGGIANGKALRRSIAPGCATYLDAPDDSGSSAADFAEVAPAPRSNASLPIEVPCPPDTFLTAFPKNPTNQTSATFQYAESPAEDGVSFDCALDWEGTLEPGDFSACSESGISYPGALAEGLHRFAVEASGAGGTDPTPKTYSWVVDTTPPGTAIDSVPPEPSNGFSATFAYHSSEESSSFRCQLDAEAIQLCSASGKTYFMLGDGQHTFRVWATDNAGNQDQSPAEHLFSVENVLRDETPPDTSVLSAPANPSRSDSASFGYASTEAGSRFECRVVGRGAFAPCPASGITYRDLPNASYIFEVRATDVAGNLDSVPAAYAWRVAAPLPKARLLNPPPGTIRLDRGVRAISLTLELSSDRPGSSFRCRLDKKPFKRCPKRTKVRAAAGRHRFEAYAIDALGNVGTYIAKRIFRVRPHSSGGLF